VPPRAPDIRRHPANYRTKPSQTIFSLILYEFCSHVTEVKTLSIITTNVSLQIEITDTYSDNRKITRVLSGTQVELLKVGYGGVSDLKKGRASQRQGISHL
jgi:hypothetical protein